MNGRLFRLALFAANLTCAVVGFYLGWWDVLVLNAIAAFLGALNLICFTQEAA